MALHIEMLRC